MSGPPDEFDALLAPAPSAPRVEHEAPRAGELLAPSPSVAEFFENWELYRDPVLSAVLAGAALAALGVFVILRRAVFLTAALSQSAALGVALAFFSEIHLGFSLSPVLGALLLSLLVTLLVSVRLPFGLSRESLVGFAFVFASALAVLVGDRIAQEAHDVAAILFGTAVLVRPLDLVLLSVGAILVFTLLFVLGRALTFCGLDPDGARVQGLPVGRIELGFWVLFALEVSLATRALGALPVFAFVLLPGMSGLLLANRVPVAILIAAISGGLSGGFGYLLAFLKELPVGAAEASTAALFALLAFAISCAKAAM